MSQVWQTLLAPIGIWFHGRLTKSSEKTVKQYSEKADRLTLSKDLVNVLGNLIGNHENLRDIFKQHAAIDKDGVLH